MEGNREHEKEFGFIGRGKETLAKNRLY